MVSRTVLGKDIDIWMSHAFVGCVHTKAVWICESHCLNFTEGRSETRNAVKHLAILSENFDPISH